MSLKTVSIVGTAGRKGGWKKMSKELYTMMCNKAKVIITQQFGLELPHVHLVSGGAAWADHIAVHLYLADEVGGLTLHLPTRLCTDGQSQFYDNGLKDWKTNPGHTANKLHKEFSKKLDEDTLQQLTIADTVGAKLFVHSGFHERNTHVAASDYLLAFTWGSGDVPMEGGTMDTWKKCRGTKHHVSLESFGVSPRKRRIQRKSFGVSPKRKRKTQTDIRDILLQGK